MTTTAMVNVYINQFCVEIGCTADSIYSKDANSWNFTRGSASVELVLTSYETAVKTVRTFVRCFSPVCPIPADAAKKAQLFEEALENSTTFMGAKLGIIPERGYMYAIAERDIDGMDYEEFKTLVTDLGYWADQLDDMLIQRFGTTAALN
jgi:hypothetical protein